MRERGVCGTAGCVLASRLSEDPTCSVLLLERGIANDTWISRVPLASGNIYDPKTGAVYWYSEPMKDLNDRKAPIFRGEILGETSRINGIIYTRGSVADYDIWSIMGDGHPDWTYKKVLPYFRKGERALNKVETEYRGNSGPWIIQDMQPVNWPFRVFSIVQECAEALGFSKITDTNSPDALCDGFATLDVTVNKNMQRMSTFDAFLPRELTLQRINNLTICTRAIVSRVEFTTGPTSTKLRADRVLFQDASLAEGGNTYSVRAKKEIIICAGASGSPQILMLSGIGPGEHLREHDIKVIRDLPGVGSELNDHVSIPLSWEVPIAESLSHLSKSAWKGLAEFLKYLALRIGLLSIPFQVASLYVRSSSLDPSTYTFIPNIPSKPPMEKTSMTQESDSGGTDRAAEALRNEDCLPDIEIMPLANTATDDIEENKTVFTQIGIFTLLSTLLRPKSRGMVRLASSNARDRPRVTFQYMSHAEDISLAKKAIRLAMKLSEEMKAKKFPLLRSITAPCLGEADEDKQLEALIRRRAGTTYHYSSTCRMASESDPKAPGVVDDCLRVHGVTNLRVCDASIFPQVISAHLQAPVVMVAEKCADMIRSSSA